MSVTVNMQAAQELLDAFGGEDTFITLIELDDGHSGDGLYGYFSEYPEEGTMYFGPVE